MQREYFHEEYKILNSLAGTDKVKSRKLRRRSSLRKLDPFIDSDGLIRVGGRLRRSGVEIDLLQHPVVIPKKSEISTLLIRDAHEKVAHSGRYMTLNQLKNDGFWLINATSAISKYIHKCVTCRELRGKVAEQKMADLPEERCTVSAPFTHCGVDMFGPFLIKERRSEVKRYGCLFTCLSSRAVHLISIYPSNLHLSI